MSIRWCYIHEIGWYYTAHIIEHGVCVDHPPYASEPIDDGADREWEKVDEDYGWEKGK